MPGPQHPQISPAFVTRAGISDPTDMDTPYEMGTSDWFLAKDPRAVLCSAASYGTVIDAGHHETSNSISSRQAGDEDCARREWLTTGFPGATSRKGPNPHRIVADGRADGVQSRRSGAVRQTGKLGRGLIGFPASPVDVGVSGVVTSDLKAHSSSTSLGIRSAGWLFLSRHG